MIPHSNSSDEALFSQFVQDWYRHLFRKEFNIALAAIDEPNSYGVHWTEESIATAISQYSPGGFISDPSLLPPDRHQSLVPFADESGYSFHSTVPINGTWSDLTAQFEFLTRPEGFAVILHDLHVL